MAQPFRRRARTARRHGRQLPTGQWTVITAGTLCIAHRPTNSNHGRRQTIESLLGPARFIFFASNSSISQSTILLYDTKTIWRCSHVSCIIAFSNHNAINGWSRTVCALFQHLSLYANVETSSPFSSNSREHRLVVLEEATPVYEHAWQGQRYWWMLYCSWELEASGAKWTMLLALGHGR